METIADRKHRAEEGGAVALPWVERTAAAWLLGYPVGIAPEDLPVIEAVAAALVQEALGRMP